MRVLDTDAWRCQFLLAIVGSAVGHVASLTFLHALNFSTEFHGTLVGSCPSLPNGNLMVEFFRFMFSGGSNVTLEGSGDPQWGWVDSHGQQVREKLLVTSHCVLIEAY